MSRYTGHFEGPALLALPLLGLNFFVWIILLAGVAALQEQCNSQAEVINADVPVGSIFPATSCSSVYRFQWWETMLQLFTLVCCLVSVGLGWTSNHRIALVALLATITVLLMLDTNTFLYVRDAIDHGSLWRRANTFLAGALLSSLFNFLLIFALGHDGPLPIGGAYGNRGVAKTSPADNGTLPATAPAPMHTHHTPTTHHTPAAAPVNEPVTEPPVANQV